MDVFVGAGRVEFDLQSSVTTSVPLTLQAKESDYELSMGLGLRWWFIKNTVEGRFIFMTQKSAGVLWLWFRGRGADRDAVGRESGGPFLGIGFSF